MSGAFLKFPRQLTPPEAARLTKELETHAPAFSESLVINHFRGVCRCGHVLGNFKKSTDGKARCQARVMEHVQDVVGRFFGPARVGDA